MITAVILRATNLRWKSLLWTATLLVLWQVVVDFLALVVPALMWVAKDGAALVLLMDVGCMAYVGAVLFAVQEQERVAGDLKRLGTSRYKLTPA